MDANGTRYHLLLGAGDWLRCRDEEGRALADTERPGSGIAWDTERSELTLRALQYTFPSAGAERPPALADRRGAGRDRFGNWYWVDPARRGILVRSSGDDVVSTFWSPEAAAGERPDERGGFGDRERRQPRELVLAGLAVTEDHFLGVGIVEPSPGLLVFDLQSGGPAVELSWPEDVPFEPFDLAPRTGGGVFVLDRTNRRLWELDRSFAVVSRAEGDGADEAPPRHFRAAGEAGQTPEEPPRAPLRLQDAAPVTGDPIAVDGTPDCEALVLDAGAETGGARLIHFARSATAGEPLRIVSDEPLAAHDFAFVPLREPTRFGRVYLAAATGNQAFAVDLVRERATLRASLVMRFFPMRRFGGKALVTAGGEAYYDFGEAWLRLVEQRRTRYAPVGTVETPPLDGREPGCAWHRVLIDACLPPDASVHVSTRAADSEAELELAAWSREPDPRPRPGGSELPFRAASAYDPLELLVQRSRGRFLQVRLELRGDGRSSPRIRALRVYYPRFSYLEQYLPAVYREDDTSASFLDRFLANLEGILTGIEDRIAGAQALIDPRSVPADALEWLAGWFDVALDPAWSARRRRLFIANATQFFQYRGTVRGVELALRLAVEPPSREEADLFSFHERQPHERGVQIVERYQTRRTPGILDAPEERRERSELRTSQWRPADGVDDLNDRYREFVRRTLGSVNAALRYTLTPQPASFAGEWRRFSEAVLGFAPSATAADAPAWQAFLSRRYRRASELNGAYGTNVSSFAAVPLPETVPTDAARLRDWFQFEAVVLGTRRTAHSFTVLLPAPAEPEPARAAAEAARLTRLAERVVELEKPAHTVFGVGFSWSAFKLGEARLGADTVTDRGSRAAALLATTILGRARVGESFLAGTRARHLVERAPARRQPPPDTTPPDRRHAP